MKQGIVIQGPVNFYKELADYYSKFDNVVSVSRGSSSSRTGLGCGGKIY